MMQIVRVHMLRNLMAALLVAMIAGESAAQEARGPLTFEGLNQQLNHSAVSRAFGGVTVGDQSGVGLMFLNPASLGRLDGLQVSVAGLHTSRDISQVQHFAPVRYYPNLSLLLENRTDAIPDPDPDLVGFTPADSVQRPFDDITPDWSRSTANTLPLHALAAVPITLGGVTLTAGAGAVQYANMNYFYQNNNGLTPAVLSQRPLPTLRPTDDNPIVADWYQSVLSREGSMHGYGMALAAHVPRYNITIGVSGLRLTGSTDDVEQRIERGRLTFLANEFRADSSDGRITKTGTSDFSAQQFTIGGTLNSQYVSLGAAVTPPTAFTRTYAYQVVTDTSGTAVTTPSSGEDEFELPWRGSVGLLLRPRDGLRIGLEYEWRPYASASFTNSAGLESEPWQSSSLFRIGAEYELASWLVLRGGLRGEADVFVPEGSAFVDEPVGYRIYTVGVGLSFSGVRWSVAYENANVEYQDVWGSAVSRNNDVRHTVLTQLSVALPWGL